ncbi:MAG: hypothetical protein ACO3EL_06205 [Burkholderiaceae bacterium]
MAYDFQVKIIQLFSVFFGFRALFGFLQATGDILVVWDTTIRSTLEHGQPDHIAGTFTIQWNQVRNPQCPHTRFVPIPLLVWASPTTPVIWL